MVPEQQAGCQLDTDGLAAAHVKRERLRMMSHVKPDGAEDAREQMEPRALSSHCFHPQHSPCQQVGGILLAMCVWVCVCFRILGDTRKQSIGFLHLETTSSVELGLLSNDSYFRKHHVKQSKSRVS